MNKDLQQSMILMLNIQDVPVHSAHLVCSTLISNSNHRIKAKSLIDTGASSSFVSSNFVRAHKIPTIVCEPIPCQMADGSTVVVNRQALIT